MASPEDPVTKLEAGAAQQHEMFMAYVQAGFTRPEALEIIIAIIVTHISIEDE